MSNLVQELDALSAAISLETSLRAPTERELSAGLETGPMRQAHDAEVESCVRLARLVVAKADAFGIVAG
jgi:hypothetical protein